MSVTDGTEVDDAAIDAALNGGMPDPPSIPTLAALLGELTAADEVARRGRIRETVRSLIAAESGAETLNDYRGGLVTAGFITGRNIDGLITDARRDHKTQVRAARGKTQADQAQWAEVVRESRLLESAVDRYEPRGDGCLWAMQASGEWDRVATFVPRIVAHIHRDDGSGPAGVTSTFRIRVSLPGGQSGEVDVTPAQLPDSVEWATRAVGHRAVVLPAPSARDHIRAAAQLLASEHVEATTVYLHTGWRTLGGRNRYLTASGALGADGLDTGASVDLAGPLSGFRLPDPNAVPQADLHAAVRASIEILEIAPDEVIIPVIGTAHRAALPLSPDGGTWIVGRTGSGKSQIAALAQQHYGSTLDDKNFPGAWAATGNALADKAFLLANALYVVDDYIPTGSSQDIARMQKAADNLIRGSANGAGRDRLDANATLRPSRPPRAQVLATGEDLPPGHSLRGRLFIAELAHDGLKWDALTGCQRQARDGVYALAQAGYIRWIAGRMDEDPEYASALAARRVQLRAQATTTGQHRRTPDMVASLALGWRVWLDYATAIGAIDGGRRAVLARRIWNALIAGADTQAEAQKDANPVRIYLDSLTASIVDGHAHLTGMDGGCPPQAQAWGWTSEMVGTEMTSRPHGSRIGWVGGDHVYLDPEAAYAMAVRHGRASGLPALPAKVTLQKRLHDAGVLASTRVEKAKTRLTVRVSVDGHRRAEVLHVHPSSLGVGDA